MKTVTKRTFKSILKIAPKHVKNTTGLCICDKCKKTFEPKTALLEKCNNISFKGGYINVKCITEGKNTWYLVSPCCKEVHLFGFDTK